MDPKNLFDFSTEIDVPVGPSGLAEDLLKEVLQARKSLMARILSGSCKTFESYAEAVGGLRQLDFVLAYPARKADKLRAELGPTIEEDE